MTNRDEPRAGSSTDSPGDGARGESEDGPGRLTAYLGLLAAIVAFGTIFLTTAIAPWFSWTHDALSNLGDPGQWSLYWMFNVGMILAGVLGAASAARVTLASRNRVQFLGSVVMTLAILDLALIGYFHIPRDLHGPVSVAFFVLLSYGTMLYGTGEVLDGAVGRGLALVWLGIVHVTQWVVWAVQDVATGVAIPEFVGAVVVLIWMLLVLERLTDRSVPLLPPRSRADSAGGE